MPDAPVVLIIEDEPDLADLYAEWLGDDYVVRTATDGETALWHFDESVDVVLLDRRLPDMSGEELLGQLKESGVECQFAMLTGVEPGFEILKLDIDEYVRKPIERGELRELVDRLEERKAVEEAISSYLALLSKKRALESEYDAAELDSEPSYRSLTSEIVTRRRQIESLLNQLDESGVAVTDVSDVDTDDEREIGRTPVYKRRPKEFYGLWLLAALTYGAGDIVSTVYAVFLVPGIEEANPIVDALLQNFGVSGFLLFKLFVFFVLISISVQGARTEDRFSYYWPPALATLLGAGLTLWNLSLIF